MLSENVLSEICFFLDLKDLLQMIQVNKKYRRAATKASLFKSEFTRIYMSGKQSQVNVSETWKSLCFDMINQERVFINLPFPSLSKDQLSRFFSKLTAILANPEIPLPRLRRDFLTYPSVMQDMLANIDDCNQTFYSDKNPEFEFIETEPNSSQNEILIQLITHAYRVILQVIKTFCDGVCLNIEESEDILKSYLESWEVYSCSIENLKDFLEPFSNKIASLSESADLQGLADFCSNLHGILANIWRDRVWLRLGNRLNTVFMYHLVHFWTQPTKFPSYELCSGYIEAVFDISCDEFLIHFKKHTKTEFFEPFKSLENFLLEGFKGFRIKDKLDLEKLNYLQRILPAGLMMKVIHIIQMPKDWKEEFEEFVNHVGNQDYIIEYNAKRIGIVQSEVGFYSRCKNLEIFDLLTHLEKFKEDLCN